MSLFEGISSLPNHPQADDPLYICVVIRGSVAVAVAVVVILFLLVDHEADSYKTLAALKTVCLRSLFSKS